MQAYPSRWKLSPEAPSLAGGGKYTGASRVTHHPVFLGLLELTRGKTGNGSSWQVRTVWTTLASSWPGAYGWRDGGRLIRLRGRMCTLTCGPTTARHCCRGERPSPGSGCSLELTPAVPIYLPGTEEGLTGQHYILPRGGPLRCLVQQAAACLFVYILQ